MGPPFPVTERVASHVLVHSRRARAHLDPSLVGVGNSNGGCRCDGLWWDNRWRVLQTEQRRVRLSLSRRAWGERLCAEPGFRRVSRSPWMVQHGHLRRRKLLRFAHLHSSHATRCHRDAATVCHLLCGGPRPVLAERMGLLVQQCGILLLIGGGIGTRRRLCGDPAGLHSGWVLRTRPLCARSRECGRLRCRDGCADLRNHPSRVHAKWREDCVPGDERVKRSRLRESAATPLLLMGSTLVLGGLLSLAYGTFRYFSRFAEGCSPLEQPVCTSVLSSRASDAAFFESWGFLILVSGVLVALLGWRLRVNDPA